jgi:hypothetical protein
MREIERVIATTHVDAHNERIAVEGLEPVINFEGCRERVKW